MQIGDGSPFRNLTNVNFFNAMCPCKPKRTLPGGG